MATADAIRAHLNKLFSILMRTEVRYPGIDHAEVKACVKKFMVAEEVTFDDNAPARELLAPKIAWAVFSQFKGEVGSNADFDGIAKAMEV